MSSEPPVGYICAPVSTKKTLTYRFVLSDEEFAGAWLREYYRRPGWRIWRVIGGPCFIALGAALCRSADLVTMTVGMASVALGIWYALKPWIAMRAVTAQRRKSGRSDLDLEVRLHRDGIRIDDSKVRTEIPWSEVVRAGSAKTYVWYELAGGNRATIPLRVVEDLGALEAKLRAHTTWT